MFGCPENWLGKEKFCFWILLNLTNYDHISLALLVSNYYKIGHKSDCFAYIATCLMWISIFEVLKVLHFRSKDFPFIYFFIFLWRYNKNYLFISFLNVLVWNCLVFWPNLGLRILNLMVLTCQWGLAQVAVPCPIWILWVLVFLTN